MRRVLRMLIAVWKFLVGILLCQTAVASVLVVGWTYRLMQRSALKAWWRAADGEGDFESFLQGDPAIAGHVDNPNWLAAQRPSASLRQRWAAASGLRKKLRAAASILVGSLAQNLRVGVAGVFNTWVITILPVTLWAFGWYTGWNNSFTKGYEQYYVGILISWIGIALFIGAMIYLPMAQARHAVTGEWKSFYQFRVVRLLVRRRAMACLVLAGAYSLASLPVSILITAPLFFEQGNPRFVDMSDAELLAALNVWFRFTAAVGFIAFVGLRVIGARVYAGAVAATVRDGSLAIEELRPIELNALARLGMDLVEPKPKAHAAIRVARTASRPVWRTSVVLATVVIWFSFVAQIYVREFLNYHPVRGFMNQPLVQLPWFRYVPDHLEASARSSIEDLASSRASQHQ